MGGKTKDFEQQMNTVQSLQTPRRSDATVIEFFVEEWSGGYVCVTRRVQPNGLKLSYIQIYRVGPRGSIKTIVDRLDY